jgi:MerR family transcriptional regulator, light-induced transcriptional regulator
MPASDSSLALSGPDAPVPAPGLTVAAVARRLGVAPATLRTWDRRYGLGPTEHSAGTHRRYGALDVARLDLMRRLVNAGAAPAEAARAALGTDVTAEASTAAELAAFDPTVDADLEPLLDELSGPHGGGHVIALPTATPSVRGLARAAMSLDSIACAQLVRDSIDRRGVVWTWDNLLVPVLVGVGQQWANTGKGVEVEHVLSESVTSALSGVVTRLRGAVNPRPVLLACVDDEMHSLPLFAVSAALAERRIATRVLGARVPHDALVASIRRTGPSVVLVWSYIGRPGVAEQLADLPAMRPAPVVLAAGPGWGELPDGIAHVTDLVDAVARITRAVGV